MPIIPVDQKFHTVPAGVDTQDRGSARANADREIYTMQDVIDSVGGGGGNVTLEAKLVSSISAGISRLQFYFGTIDATTGLPLVAGSNGGPRVSGEYAVGIATSGSAGDVVDLAVHGTFDNVRFSVGVGDTPDLSDTLYIGSASQIFEGQLTVFTGDDNFSAGRIVSTPTLVASYPGFYDVYEATVFINMPWMNSYYRDGVLYYDSTRIFRKPETGTVENGEIVKLNSSDNVERWDVSAGDTVNQIAGVTSTDTLSSNSSSAICLRGLMTLPVADVIGGATAVVGDTLYSDATNSYELTTDPTSGIQIGIVVDLFVSPDELLIDINPVKGGGGATTDLNGLTDVTITGTPGAGELLINNATSGQFVNATLTAGNFVKISNSDGAIEVAAGDGAEVEYRALATAVGSPGQVEGSIVKFGSTTGLTAGSVYVFNGTDWVAVDADAEATTKGLMGVALGTTAADGFLTHGTAYLSHDPGTAGDILYVDTVTAGNLTSTQPSATGDFVRVAGYCLADNKVFFSPSQDWIEIA